MTQPATRSDLPARLARSAGIVALGAVAAYLPLRRMYGAEGVEALLIAAAMVLAVVLVPTVIIRVEPVPTGATVLKLTAVRMGLFAASAIALFLGAAESIREPAVLTFAVLYLLALAAETVAVVQSLPKRPAGPVEDVR
jgi:hypothetical protein